MIPSLRGSRAADPAAWKRTLTQWDIPAIFGQDPLGIGPEDVRLEKLARGSPSRMVSAHIAAAIVGIALERAGYRKVKIATIARTRIVPCSAYGVLRVPGGNGDFGLVVPTFAIHRIGGQAAAAAGWMMPNSSADTSALVPRWALAQAAFVSAIVDPTWIAIAAISPFFTTTIYPVRVDRDQSVALVRRAAEWFRAHLEVAEGSQPAAAGPLSDLPPLRLDAGDMTASGEVLDLLQQLRDMEAEQAVRRLNASNLCAEIMARMGSARRILHPRSGAVMAEISDPRSSWQTINPSPSGQDLAILRRFAIEQPATPTLHVTPT